MKKKNIILICIVAVVIVICILGVVIGFGLDSSEDKSDKKNKNKVSLSQDLLDDEEDSDEETESATQETATSNGDEIEYSTEEITTEEATTEEVTTEEVSTEEDSTVKEDEVIEPETIFVDREIDRLSYEYLIIDGKSVYSEYSVKINELFNCINDERTKAGKKALVFDTDISYIACARASLMAYENTIVGNQKAQYYDLMKESGISFAVAVENTAAGYTLASEVVSGDGTSWKTSTKHYNNMISDKYTKVGVGVDYSDTMGYVWVAIFSN